MAVAATDLNDDSDDFSDEYEFETVPGDKISVLNTFNEDSDVEAESKSTIISGPSARERLERLREERALRLSVCDELYNPENSLD